MNSKINNRIKSSKAALRKMTRAIAKSGAVQLIDAVPMPIMLLDANRQVVYANTRLLETVNETDLDAVLGRRPGDLLSCVHALSCEEGCGHTAYCTQCGALEAIIQALEGAQATRDCRMLRHVDGQLQALDLKVNASPMVVLDVPLTMLCIQDVSDEKRRVVLERLFFHDLINMAGSLKGLVELLVERQGGDSPTNKILVRGFTALFEEIKSHQALSAAESGQLPAHPTDVDTLETVRSLTERYQMHLAAHMKTVVADPDTARVVCHTDTNLVQRVLGNMLKNALEAALEGDTITIGCAYEPESDWPVVFHVHNPNPMPPDVQLQVFKRSFSTKGLGRGLGTYSIKLFTENYLGGKVSFASSEAMGTVFRAALPLRLPE
ncbi:MAG: PAS domain-containing sensor histidine kinase [Desulfovibrionaceae bacterium]